jgi:diguanylate cyclase (GGDEF)-like protein
LDISHSLAQTLSPRQLYRTIYKETGRVLEATGFYVSLYHPVKDQATVVFFADQGVERNVEISYKGSESEVLRTGKASIISDRTDDQSLLAMEEQSDEMTRSAISAPLLYEGKVVGAISAQSYEAGAYSEADLELLQGIADLAAAAIKNAHYVSELESRRREAERIEEIGRAITSSLDTTKVLRKIIDAVRELMSADGSSVLLLSGVEARVAASGGEAGLPEGVRWQFSERMYQAVVEDRRALIIEDLPQSALFPRDLAQKTKAGSGLMVPLVLDNDVAGALSAVKLTTRGFVQDDVDTLLRLAGQASVALANARLHQDIQALSLTDPLTGLPNRRHLDIHLKREIAAARRGRGLCVVLFDLDDFKNLNDRMGHVAGDDILKAFGRILMSETRAMNLAARYGGDEFVSVLSDISAKGAELHAARIQSRVAGDPELAGYDVSVSFGVGTFDESAMTDTDDLVRAADENLYESKSRLNRNRGKS